MYKVSILVPVYRVERFINRCARSLFEQSYPELEFIFINDGSPDQSIDILRQVMDDYPQRKDNIKIINHIVNKGLATSRNSGIENASGEFVCFVDSDDWLELNAIKVLVHKQLINDVDIVSGNRMVHSQHKEVLFREREYDSKNQMILQMMRRTWDHFLTGRIIRRSLFLLYDLKWKDGYDLAEDRYMMTMLAYYTKGFDTVDDIIYHYDRRNEKAISIIKNRETVLRYNKQELGNVLALEYFFRDKELVYQRECAYCVMEQLSYNLSTALAYADRQEYYTISNMINERKEEHLQNFGSKGLRIKTRYGWMRLKYLTNKGVRVIFRLLGIRYHIQ